MTPDLAQTPHCNGKVIHATAGGAYDALRRQLNYRKFTRRAGTHLNVYRCSHCTGWHIGSAAKSEHRWSEQ